MGTYHTHIPLPGTRDSNDDTIQGGLGIFLLASLDQKKNWFGNNAEASGNALANLSRGTLIGRAWLRLSREFHEMAGRDKSRAVR